MNPAMLTMLAGMMGISPEDLHKLATNAQTFFATNLTLLTEIKETQVKILEHLTNDGHTGNIDPSGTFEFDANGSVKRLNGSGG